MKVLIVDDSMAIRHAISKTVTEMGYEPIEAENGAEALIKLKSSYQQVVLTILDWNMPVMDGMDVLRKVKNTEEYAHIPVLMATSDGIKEDVIKALKAGAASYLVKPFKSEELQARIEEILNAVDASVKSE
ncbi:MAG: response regulator [candidate division Zixibacteria bacterium]|nr:response regulator [candidate division Zixibacteria bacterium]